MRWAAAALLALGSAACGAAAGVGTNGSAASFEARAAKERSIPPGVKARGTNKVEPRLQARPQPPGQDSVDPSTAPLDEVVRSIASQHPGAYYMLATRLFEAGRNDEAVFWFYAGQLRYRIRLACHPDFEPSGEPALFGSLQAVVGEQINEYAGADPDAWIAAMERVLEWDERTPNDFEPKVACEAQVAEQRGGMRELVEQVRQNKDQIRAGRAAQGLPNR